MTDPSQDDTPIIPYYNPPLGVVLSTKLVLDIKKIQELQEKIEAEGSTPDTYMNAPDRTVFIDNLNIVNLRHLYPDTVVKGDDDVWDFLYKAFAPDVCCENCLESVMNELRDITS